MTIEEKLMQINSVKTDIKNALIEKNMDMDSVAFDGYADKVRDIPAAETPQPLPMVDHGFGLITLNDEDRTQIEVLTAEDFNVLCASSSTKAVPTSPITINNVVLWLSEILTFQFGADFNLTTINSYFLGGATTLNKISAIPNCVTYIASNFLYSCYWFNGSIVLPNKLDHIETGFLNNCYSFNQQLNIPASMTTGLGGSFMKNCVSFNKPIILPSSVTVIPSEFLMGCYNFNQELNLPPKLTVINMNFMQNCYAFSRTIKVPDTATAITASFMSNCHNFTSLDIGAVNPAKFTVSDNTLSTTVVGKMNYVGVTVIGDNSAAFVARFPAKTTSPYRNVIAG
ncbi:hypothetical protein EQG49_02260 [Periweissella cryptocerci]|uniref:Leucine-rich repeat domain-containing protein n=1 Tax=Periweissella cryptocerci TaxID=2506420 RepID=A0A4P6YRX8_9LACO|nr:leucine-rich repeat protein [Periweissella cryptocerci]QBO35370.1 hypothetical protein EQG49_02260 [Periweissella cryptocerci]